MSRILDVMINENVCFKYSILFVFLLDVVFLLLQDMKLPHWRTQISDSDIAILLFPSLLCVDK